METNATTTTHTLQITSAEAMEKLGFLLGKLVRGHEVFALNGDVGTGKTTLTKGIAKGMDIDEVVQSPTFTIERNYQASGKRQLVHYDFYRLNDPGIMRDELYEAITTPGNVVVIEWNEIVRDVLQGNTIAIDFAYDKEATRQLTVHLPASFTYLEPVFTKERQ